MAKVKVNGQHGLSLGTRAYSAEDDCDDNDIERASIVLKTTRRNAY